MPERGDKSLQWQNNKGFGGADLREFAKVGLIECGNWQGEGTVKNDSGFRN